MPDLAAKMSGGKSGFGMPRLAKSGGGGSGGGCGRETRFGI